jgi:hypothetical protein
MLSASASSRAGLLDHMPRSLAAPPFSHADPTATHEVRSGVDERCVTNVGDARAGLVLGRFWLKREMAHYKLAV